MTGMTGDYDPEDPPEWDRVCAWAMIRCPTSSDYDGLVPLIDPDQSDRVLWAHPGCVEREYGDRAPTLLEAGARREKQSARWSQNWDDYDEL